METNKQKQYYPAIDVLRIIAILAVILIHTTTRTLEIAVFDFQKAPLALFFNQISRFAVPLFFMISGFVLELNYSFHPNFFSYLKRRISKIFIPYIVWSAIYYFFIYTNHNRSYFSALLDGGASYQLYFIPSLLIFYLLFPLIHKFYNFFANKWVIIPLGIFQITLLYLDYFITPFRQTYPVKIAILSYFVFLLGVVAARHKDFLIALVKKWKYIFVISTFALGIYVYLEGKTLYLATHNYLTFYSQWRPSVFFYTLSFGLLFYYLFSKKIFSHPLVKSLSGLSFFVFFVHVIILEFIWKHIGLNLFHNNKHIVEQFWYDPVFFLAVSIASFTLAYLAHRIPYLSKLTA
jgi:probable poly-beta-1,6-N-acetyl-D-glucosamine export protein